MLKPHFFLTDGELTLTNHSQAAKGYQWLLIRDSVQPVMQKLVLIEGQDADSAIATYRNDHHNYRWVELGAGRNICFIQTGSRLKTSYAVVHARQNINAMLMATYHLAMPDRKAKKSSFRIHCRLA